MAGGHILVDELVSLGFFGQQANDFLPVAKSQKR
jgi:hypothetical protein